MKHKSKETKDEVRLVKVLLHLEYWYTKNDKMDLVNGFNFKKNIMLPFL